MEGARDLMSRLSSNLLHQLLQGDSVANRGGISFSEQLRDHDIRQFGQNGKNSLLAHNGLLGFF